MCVFFNPFSLFVFSFYFFGVCGSFMFRVMVDKLGLQSAFSLCVCFFHSPFLTFLWVIELFLESHLGLFVAFLSLFLVFLEIALGVTIYIHNLYSPGIRVLLLWVKYTSLVSIETPSPALGLKYFLKYSEHTSNNVVIFASTIKYI